MRHQIAAFALPIFSLAVFGQSAPDTNGWLAARWGMTTQQVRAAIPESRLLNSPERDKGMLVWLEASPVRLGSYPATAKFEFEVGKNYLSSVDVVVADSVSRESAYQNLRQALIEKYDKPISEDLTRGQNTFGDRSEQRTVQWRLKSSMIVLTWYELGGFGYVGVRYSERRAEENL